MKLFYCLLFFFLSTSLNAQTTGFFGKKNIVEFGITAQSPLLYNYYAYKEGAAYSAKKGVLEAKMPVLNYGFRLSVGRMLERNTGAYLETGLSYFSVAPDTYFSNASTSPKYSDVRGEMLDIRCFSIMPKIEITTRDGLLPIGVSNQFGFGANFYKTQSRDYIGTANIVDSSTWMYIPVNITKDNYYDYSNKAIKGYTLLYKLNMRIPINDRILYHFGFRYTLNFVPSSFDYSTSSNEVMSRANMWESIRHKETRSLITFETGISYAF